MSLPASTFLLLSSCTCLSPNVYTSGLFCSLKCLPLPVQILCFLFDALFLFPDIDAVQFSSVAQSCPTLCNPMNRSTPGLPVHH